MDRRAFLQALAIALSVSVPAAQSRPTLTLKKQEAKPEIYPTSAFDPKHQWGNAVLIGAKESVDHAKELLLADARKILPKGTQFYVIEGPDLKTLNKLNQQDGFYLAWYYSPRRLGQDFSKRIICETIA